MTMASPRVNCELALGSRDDAPCSRDGALRHDDVDVLGLSFGSEECDCGAADDGIGAVCNVCCESCAGLSDYSGLGLSPAGDMAGC